MAARSTVGTMSIVPTSRRGFVNFPGDEKSVDADGYIPVGIDAQARLVPMPVTSAR
jgi:hypothetical protein